MSLSVARDAQLVMICGHFHLKVIHAAMRPGVIHAAVRPGG